ncbi:MAG: HD-GYP domain-containing protein [Firmicutes bacterium]|nr:HD-GYP domain-containing protein [Bacillota bacterium]
MRQKLFKPYAVCCAAAALLFQIASFMAGGFSFDFRLILILILLLVNASYQVVSVESMSSFSITYPLLFPAIAFFSPAWASALAAFGAFSADEFRLDWPIFVYNRGALGLSAGLSALAFHALGGTAALPTALPGAVLVYSAVNHGLFVFGSYLRFSDSKFEWFFLVNVAKTLIPSVALSALFFMAYTRYDILGLIVAFFLFVVVRSGALLGHLEANYRLSLIRALLRATHAKDPTLMRHLENVAYYSKRLAKACRYPFWKLHILDEAAYFHDIGKLEIDDSILKKAGKLTPEEYEEMQSHPVRGIEFLKEVNLPPSHKAIVESIAGYHHERYDGTGYPHGLKGEEIPLEARIVAVADTWDAMVGERCYRKPMPIAEAIAELRRVKGTQLDPELVELFIQIIENDHQDRQGVRVFNQNPVHVL